VHLRYCFAGGALGVLELALATALLAEIAAVEPLVSRHGGTTSLEPADNFVTELAHKAVEIAVRRDERDLLQARSLESTDSLA
jgi:hypothetical protein